MKIETKRLFLREMTPDDFGALYAVLADSDIMQHYPYTFDTVRVRNWINKNIDRYQVFGFVEEQNDKIETDQSIRICR